MTVAAVAAALVGVGLAAAPDALAPPATTASSAAVGAIPPQNVQATVQPNPSQQIVIQVPPNYDTSKLPNVVSQDPNLILVSLSYGYQPDGTQILLVNLANPFPTEAETGAIVVYW